MSDLKIEPMNVSDLIPYEKNPRRNDQAVESVAASIREFGFRVPIIIDQNNVIVCGHTRLKAAKKLKLQVVPCVRADDLTEEQIKAYRLADNKTAEQAEWDLDLLQGELTGITELDMGLFGFDPIAVTADVQEDDFEPELPEEPVTKPGDIWSLGRHRLMCGDSTSELDVTALMNGQLADMYLTDPPYNVDYTGKTKDALKIENDAMSDETYREFLQNAFSQADCAMKAGAVFYIWHADSEGYNVRAACIKSGWDVRQCLIWRKNSMVMGRQDYHWMHEPCLYGWKGGAAHLWASDRKQTTILDFDRPTKSKEHPTMKPVKLFDYQIQNNTKGQDIVYDGFAGSGTTIVACEQNGRTAYCMEHDPRYCDVIVKRWETLTGQTAVLQGKPA